MPQRMGKYTIELTNTPSIVGYAAVVGDKEAKGPLGQCFDKTYKDAFFGEKTFEKAETKMQKMTIETAVKKSGLSKGDIQIAFAGDLLNQCIGSFFGLKGMEIPLIGLYGACSTMALSMLMAANGVDSGLAQTAAASTSSHFCSAEKQFRMPLEYGGQRTPTAQWTATAAGAAVSAGAAAATSAAPGTSAPGRRQSVGSPWGPTAQTFCRQGTSSPSSKKMASSSPSAVDSHSKLALSVS